MEGPTGPQPAPGHHHRRAHESHEQRAAGLSAASDVLRLGEENGIWIDAYRFHSLAPLFELAERVPIEEVA